MICEHCGSKVVDGDHICEVCGMAPKSIEPRRGQMAKVIPFRPKQRTVPAPPTTARRSARRHTALWWIVAIIAIALVLPYILPLTR